MATVKTGSELIESHKPKNFKYKYIIKDPTLYDELHTDNYDMSNLDTINNDELIEIALNAEYHMYDRSVVGKMKEPTLMDDGVIISKAMVTKSDKKLTQIGLAFFDRNDRKHVVVRMYYDRFDIIEIFILT